MAQTAPQWNGFAGSGLTNGSFHEMHNSYLKFMYATIQDKDKDPLKAREMIYEYAGKIQRLQDFINQQQAFTQTAAIAKADQIRDVCWQAFEHAIDYLDKLPIDHPLYENVHAIALAKAPYKGLNTHEMTKQTSEMDGLYNALTRNYQMDVKVKALGLDKILKAAYDANTTIREQFKSREEERGQRQATKAGDTTDSLRASILESYNAILRRVNAVAELMDTSSEDYGTVEYFIQNVNGVAEHYRRVMAQKGRKSGDTTPTDVNTDTADGTTNDSGASSVTPNVDDGE